MATSVPDTVISIRDARDGDYDDAVANALGSNIFDICFALGFPLFLFTLIYGPIQMSADISQQSGELRFMLLWLTVMGFCVYYFGKTKTDPAGIRYVEMKRGKAFLLLIIYLAFVLYVVGRSMDALWADQIARWIHNFLELMPKFG